MSNLIKLKNFKTSKTILIDYNEIDGVNEKVNGGTVVFLKKGVSFLVQESPDQINEMIEEKENKNI